MRSFFDIGDRARLPWRFFGAQTLGLGHRADDPL
jgi:hypothetical protein